MRWLLPFVAGFAATLLFHQGLIALLHAGGVISFDAWRMAPTWPFGIPQVVSLAFWGGVWGIVLWLVLKRWRGPGWWGGWIALGALGPTAVAVLVVLPLKGIAVSGATVVLGAILNGFWGLGSAILLDALRRVLRSIH